MNKTLDRLFCVCIGSIIGTTLQIAKTDETKVTPVSKVVESGISVSQNVINGVAK